MSQRFIPGIASQSLGSPQHHSIAAKLQAAAGAGLKAIEIFYEDIAQLAASYQRDPHVLELRFQSSASSRSFSNSTQADEVLLACARQIRQWCLDTEPHSLQIICLQPFMHFEGLLDFDERDRRFEKLDFWIHLAKHLGTTLIQIPSNFLPESQCSGTRVRLVEDLREAAEVGAQQIPTIRFAYEALCWGTHINTWDAAWSIVEEVDMPNFGTCLDTFNIAGRVYADPERSDGKNATADADIAQSIQKLRDTFSDPEKLKKVFYVELCDGEILDTPLDSNHEWYNSEQPSRMSWSRNARLYPFETDVAIAQDQNRGAGYLPVTEIFDALLDIGYEGYVSFEVFNRSLNQPGDRVVEDHARRAGASWVHCVRHIDNFLAARLHEEDQHGEERVNVEETISAETLEQQQDLVSRITTGNLVNISPRL